MILRKEITKFPKVVLLYMMISKKLVFRGRRPIDVMIEFIYGWDASVVIDDALLETAGASVSILMQTVLGESILDEVFDRLGSSDAQNHARSGHRAARIRDIVAERFFVPGNRGLSHCFRIPEALHGARFASEKAAKMRSGSPLLRVERVARGALAEGPFATLCVAGRNLLRCGSERH